MNQFKTGAILVFIAALFDKGTNKELEANIDLFTSNNLNMSGTYAFTSFSGETVPQ